jgi:Response regulators consisting of a CheY-like receiver domain and a winged-helix DNA-binding domain
MNSPESAVILLAEDRDDDIVLIRKAFEKAELANPMYVVKNGEEGVAYLMGEEPFSNRNEYPLPDLILLDLKMPKLDGFETLLWIRNQPGIRNIPVVILTSSENLGDVTKAYALGANSFLVKPVDFEHSIELVKVLHKYWLRTSRLPQTFRPEPKINGNPSVPSRSSKPSH